MHPIRVPHKTILFSCAAVWGGGEVFCQDLVKFLLRKYASPQAFTPEGASCEFVRLPKRPPLGGLIQGRTFKWL